MLSIKKTIITTRKYSFDTGALGRILNFVIKFGFKLLAYE
jgi:hypothetical protein